MILKCVLIVYAAFLCVTSIKASVINLPETNKTERIEMFKKIIECGSLAPSGHNSQPWKFSMEDSAITIHPDYSRRLPAVDPDDRELFISLGCALENLVVAAEHFGYKSNISYMLEKEHCEEIKVVFTKSDVKTGLALFEQIEKRQTTRNEYSGEKVSKEMINEIEKISAGNNVKTVIKTDSVNIQKIIELVKSGNMVQFADDAFMDELKFWIRFSHAEAEEKSDGLASEVMGNPSVPRWLGKLYMNMFYSAKEQNEKDEKFIKSSAGIAFIYSTGNSKIDWIETGRVYERFSLFTTSKNIKCAFINQPIEVPQFLDKTKEAFGLKNIHPQLLLRFGYSEAMPKSPRRKTEDVIIAK